MTMGTKDQKLTVGEAIQTQSELDAANVLKDVTEARGGVFTYIVDGNIVPLPKKINH